MFRVTHMMRELLAPTPPGPRRQSTGPVVIWNLTRRCNLACTHCYSISSDRAYPGELTLDEICAVMDDLRAFGVPALILSGGEPLLHPDLWSISARARAMGFVVALSSNGALIDEDTADRIAAAGYDYVGISLDGLEAVHDRFRGRAGAFAASRAAVRRCVRRGLRVGIRFTLTQANADQLDGLLELMHEEGAQKFYLSHLNYGGRGKRHRTRDAVFATTRRALDRLFAVAWGGRRGRPRPRVRHGQQRRGRRLSVALGPRAVPGADGPPVREARGVGRERLGHHRRQHRQ